jgi:hypothetical protein
MNNKSKTKFDSKSIVNYINFFYYIIYLLMIKN